MKHALTSLALLGASCAPVWAGSVAEPIVTEVAAPVPVAPPALGGNWTRIYGGLQLGNLDVDGTGAADGSDTSYGLHAGYDYDFGRFVLVITIKRSRRQKEKAQQKIRRFDRCPLRADQQAVQIAVFVALPDIGRGAIKPAVVNAPIQSRRCLGQGLFQP